MKSVVLYTGMIEGLIKGKSVALYTRRIADINTEYGYHYIMKKVYLCNLKKYLLKKI